jgi:hypothetical protein
MKRAWFILGFFVARYVFKRAITISGPELIERLRCLGAL